MNQGKQECKECQTFETVRVGGGMYVLVKRCVKCGKKAD